MDNNDEGSYFLDNVEQFIKLCLSYGKGEAPIEMILPDDLFNKFLAHVYKAVLDYEVSFKTSDQIIIRFKYCDMYFSRKKIVEK